MGAFPTLKRGANDHCAYGAPPAILAIVHPLRWTRGSMNTQEPRTARLVKPKGECYHCSH